MRIWRALLHTSRQIQGRSSIVVVVDALKGIPLPGFVGLAEVLEVQGRSCIGLGDLIEPLVPLGRLWTERKHLLYVRKAAEARTKARQKLRYEYDSAWRPGHRPRGGYDVGQSGCCVFRTEKAWRFA